MVVICMCVPPKAEVRPRKKASHSEEDMSFSSSDESVTARMGHIDGAASSMEAGREPSAAFSSLHLEAELEVSTCLP